MNKVLYIRDCYFKLPEDFNGTCGNALMLLALHRLEKEGQLAIMDRMERKARQNAEHMRKVARNPLYRIACMCGLF